MKAEILKVYLRRRLRYCNYTKLHKPYNILRIDIAYYTNGKNIFCNDQFNRWFIVI